MSETETVMRTERWVYIGQRISSKHLLCYAWQNDEDDPDSVVLYRKLKGSVIGGIYEVETDDKTVGLHPKWTEEKVSPERCLELTAESRADEVDYARRQREKKATNNDELRELCAPLKALMRKQIGRRRAALLAAIMDEISR